MPSASSPLAVRLRRFARTVAGVCAVGGVLASVTPLAACGAPAEDDAGESADAVQGGTRYPIILVHGYNASPATRGFYEVEPALRAAGFEVSSAVLPPFNGTDVRATYLARAIDAVLTRTGAKKVNLVAHSLGGVDARDVVARLGYGDRVASVSTIATPHRGTKTARVFEGAASSKIIQTLAGWIGCDESNRGTCDDLDLPAALASLSDAKMGAFNARTPDDSRVFYQSWAAVSAVREVDTAPTSEYEWATKRACEDKVAGDRGIAMAMQFFVLQQVVGDQGPIDGMVKVESARWGLFRGCIRTDHLGAVGQPELRGPNAVGFDHREFYLTLARDLVRRGF